MKSMPPRLRSLLPFAAIALLALLAHLAVTAQGLDYPLVDLYGHRQTQTAITAWWFINEGFRLDYITPVLGPPWSIPFEFPAYQALAAALTMLTPLDLAAAGRVVSLCFFYFGVVAACGIMRLLAVPWRLTLIVAALLLASPFYLFWSRTFMIESMATGLGLGALWSYLYVLETGRSRWLAVAVLLGSLAALTKITSYGLCLVFAGLWLAGNEAFIRRKLDGRSAARLGAYAAISAIPIAIAIAWNGYADSLKARNPLADFIVSENLSRWNFGSWSDRVDAETWLSLVERLDLLLGTAGVALFALIALLSARAAIAAIAGIAAFLTGPLVFTNLYVVHEYYYFPAGVFLLIAIAMGLASLAQRASLPVTCTLIVAMVAVMGVRYAQTYPSVIERSVDNSLVRVGREVGQRTAPDDVLLIYGIDWKPIIPLYAERKAIMDRRDRPLDSPIMEASLSTLGEARIGAMVVCDYLGRRREADIEQKAERLGLVPGPRVGRCDTWFRPDSSQS